MGTVLQLTLVAEDGARARAAADACFALGAELEAVLTTYDPASATSRMNASAGSGPFAAPPALARILADSRRLSRATGGVFDPTVGPADRALDGRGAGRPTAERPPRSPRPGAASGSNASFSARTGASRSSPGCR